MSINDTQVTWPHRYPMGYRPIIQQTDQLHIHAELSERFGQRAWLRHYGQRDAWTAGIAVETTDPAAVLVAGVRLYDLIVPNRHRTAAVVWHLISEPLEEDQPNGAWLYYWPDITPAPCPGLPVRPSVGPHAHLPLAEHDTIDLAELLGGHQQTVVSS